MDFLRDKMPNNYDNYIVYFKKDGGIRYTNFSGRYSIKEVVELFENSRGKGARELITKIMRNKKQIPERLWK